MKILVVCQYYRPEEFRINEVCESLVARGHRVTVLTGLPNYPQGTVPKEYRLGRRRTEVVAGVQVFRTMELGRGSGIFRLVLNYASFMISGSVRALRLKGEYDLIFVYQLSPITMAIPGIIVKRRLGIPLFLYCLDLWPDSIRNIVSDDHHFAFRLAGALSRYMYGQCDRIGVSSRPFVDYLEKTHKVPRGRLAYLPQHASAASEAAVGERPASDSTNFVFMGNIGIAQDVDCILEASAELRARRKISVHFVGDGSYMQRAKVVARELGLEGDVEFHGRWPASEMWRFYAMADACLLTLRGNSSMGLTMPSKLQGYMGAGKPVIGAIEGAAREVIEDARCGICVGPGDAHALAVAMERFILQPEMHAQWSRNSRDYFNRNFTIHVFIHRLESEMNCASSEFEREKMEGERWSQSEAV